MRWLLVLGGLGAVSPAVRAQERPAAEPDSACAAVLRSRGHPGSSCRSLAVAIVTRATERMYRPDPRDLQHTAPRPALAGSAAQSEAVPGVQPLAVSGVSLAAAGTDSGARSLVAITLNPAVLFVSPGDAEAIAAASRIADLTLLLPVDDLDRNGDGRVDYVGARFRLNLVGASAGRRVREAGRAFLRAVQAEADLVNEVLGALRRTESPESCGAELLEARSSRTRRVRRCGGEVGLEPDSAVYREMRERIRAAREEADARYLGLEVRADFGDPLLSGRVPDRTTALSAGLGFGRRVSGNGDGTAAGFRGRAGLRYTHLPDPGPASFGFDGGVGFELARPINDTDLVTASAGLEFRYGGKAPEDYTVIRFGFAVPVAGGAGVAVAFSAPLDGEISSTLSVSFNWSLLLSGSHRER